MLTYKAMYKYLEEGIHGEVLDFPGTISFGENLEQTRYLLSSALEDMAETYILMGEGLPLTNPNVTSSESDIEEHIYLILSATSRV
jgi:predicted RNase H-like HicB family nuclease